MSLKSFITLLAASAPQVLASCAYGTHLHPRSAAGVFEAPKFGYDATKGPINWFNLDPKANALCAHGKHQSPINLRSSSYTLIPSSDLVLDIPDFEHGAEFENLGTTVEVVAEAGSLQLDGKAYSLKQFHFHLPSEHLDNGTSMAMEVHFVWATEANDLAVIGVFIDVHDASASYGRRGGKGRNKSDAVPSDLLETVLGSVHKICTPGSTTHTKPLVMSEMVDLLKSGSFRSYSGSLTTPPCSEGVKWMVSTKKVSISTGTYLKARDVLHYNARYPQNVPGEENLLVLYEKASV
ncbi:hypothetical protein ACJ41O_014412 [Fusarium nematophilum]